MGTASKVMDALKAYDLKPSGDNIWRSNSPLRPGSNSHAFMLRVNDEEHGAFFDHAANQHGSLYELAQLLRIDVPAAHQVASTKRLYRDLDDYALAHGIDAAALRKVGWCDVEEIYDATEDQRRKRPALAFKTQGGMRYRFIDGQKPVYKSEIGYKSCWYGLKYAVQMANEKQSALVLCNGEVSTVAAQAHGIPACCVTSGEKRYPQALVKELQEAWKGEVWIAMDCDRTGREAAAEIAQQIANAVVIDMRLGDGGDLADFAILHGQGSLEALRKLSQERPPSPLVNSDEAQLAQAVGQLAQAIKQDNAPDLEGLIANIQAQVDRLSMKLTKPRSKTYAELVREARKRLRENYDAAKNGQAPMNNELMSHIPAIDNVMHGFPPELYGVIGATGMGKSFFAISLARQFLLQGPGMVVSTEMEPGRWFSRLIASIAKVSESDMRNGLYRHADDFQRVEDAMSTLEIMNCEILDIPSPTPSMVRAKFLESQDKGYGYEWLIVDSASKMSYPGAADIYSITRGVWNGLQDIYREMKVPVIVTSQLGRDVASRPAGKKAPQLEDAYGGGVIEHNCGVVMGLYNHNYYVKRGLEPDDTNLPEGVFSVRFLKHRNEDDSDAPTIRLKLVKGAGMYELNERTVNLKDFQ